MAIIEGRGKVAPVKVRVCLTNSDLIILAGESRKRAAARYKDRIDSWGRGMISANIVVPKFGPLSRTEAPIFRGFVGEYATLKQLGDIGDNSAVDFLIRRGGDAGFDLQICGLKIETKCAGGQFASSLIRTGHYGFDLAVFCHWQEPQYCFIKGWIWKEDIAKMPEDESPYGHMNRIVADVELSPFSDLIDHLAARKESICRSNRSSTTHP